MRNKIFLTNQKNSSVLQSKRILGLFGTSFLIIMIAFTAWQCREDDFTGEVIGVCPEVILTSPVNGAVNVVGDQLVTATFNVVMDPASINESTFILKKGVTPVAGIVTYSGSTATFTSTDLLEANTVYSATIKRESRDLLGSIMVKDTTWQFNTGVAPAVILTNPTDGASDVALNTLITAEFSTAMKAGTVNASTFVLKQGTTPVSGTVSYLGTTATFLPANALAYNTVYSATISRLVEDVAGNVMTRDTTWSFATPATPFVIVQYLVSLSSNIPEGGSTAGGGLFNAGSSVIVTANANPGYSFNNWTDNGLEVSTLANYSFSLNNNRVLVANFEAIVAGPPGINLRSAGDFVVLAGTGVSNIGTSTILSGDVGSFPTSTMNGLLSGNVNGTLYMVADPIVGLAKTDLTTAYNDAQGRSTNAISLPGQLGGLTLAPGLYVNSSTSGISGTGTNGILTLDAGGNPNAVWIFKMGSTLVTDTGTSIVLAGGAQAKNIYWSVGTSATLGTYSIFFGNILADQSITLTTGAKLTGRALTRIGAVTLDTNIVTKP